MASLFSTFSDFAIAAHPRRVTIGESVFYDGFYDIVSLHGSLYLSRNRKLDFKPLGMLLP